jgi:hypothetical protein
MPGLANAASTDLYYERTVMTAADARCGLFAGPISSALAASRAQARGAALRAGADQAALVKIEQRAYRAAAATACNSPDMGLAAGRVRQAFEAYAKLLKMTYPGDVSEWRADRSSSVHASRWRLSQTVSFGPDHMVFGLAGREGANVVMALARFEDGTDPVAARLVMRDTSLASRPYLDTRGADGALPMARRLPPASAQTGFGAEARSRAGADLLPKGMKSGWAFRFPTEAAGALANLDPREAVAVEFLFGDDTVRRAYVEVGDFAAGRAFLQVAGR